MPIKTFNVAGNARVQNLIRHAMLALSGRQHETYAGYPTVTANTPPPSGSHDYPYGHPAIVNGGAYATEADPVTGEVQFWQSTYKPDATVIDNSFGDQSAPGKRNTSWRVGVMFDGTVLYIKARANFRKYRVWVREKDAPNLQLAVADMFSSGDGIESFKLEFGERRHREIWVEAERTVSFVGFAVEDGDILWAPRPAPVLAVQADSQGEMAEIFPKLDGWVSVLGDCLGLRKVFNNSQGSTGFTHGFFENNDYRARFESDVLPAAPDLLVMCMSGNDYDDWSDIARAGHVDAVMSYLNVVRLALPDVPIILCGVPTWGYGDVYPDVVATEQAMADAIAAREDDLMGFVFEHGDPQGNWTYDSTPQSTHIPGNSTGNVARYCGPDEFHFSLEGHNYYGRRLAESVLTVLQGMEVRLTAGAVPPVEPDDGQYRFWGIKVTQGQGTGNGFAGFRKIKLLTGLGGTDITNPLWPVAVNHDSLDPVLYPPSATTDGSPLGNTGWKTGSGTAYPYIIMIDTGVKTAVGAIELDCWGLDDNADKLTIVGSMTSGFTNIVEKQAYSNKANAFGVAPTPAKPSDDRVTLAFVP